ncbi:PiggyBac transposable element-derived protein 4 [Cucumispora dikerogammari]|nr:PiggyBac transposable element-derived protein 4 [Cucumispora dikerogammari]
MNIEEPLQKTKKVLLKPNMIKDYDQNMSGVDIFDQMLKSYYNERKSQKWTNKLTIYLINMMVHNSFILQKTFNKNLNKINHQITYRKEIIKYLSANHDSEQKSISIKKEIKLQKRHWPCKVTNTERKACVNCRSHRVVKKTRVKCRGCDVFLCVDPCVYEYYNSDFSESSDNTEVNFLEQTL